MKQYFTSCPERIDEGRLFGFKSWQEHVAGVVFASVERGSHMYGILRERGEAVVNFPTAGSFNRCMRSIGGNGWEEDEIESAGLTAERAREIDAPRVAECPLSLECRVLWEHEGAPGSSDVTVCMKIVSVAVDQELCRAGLLYNIRSRSDIETGAKTGPEAGVITSLGPYENLPE